MKKYSLILVSLMILTFLMSGITQVYASEEKQIEHFKTKEQCLSCHGKPGFSINKDKKSVSLYVDDHKLGASIHGVFECNACHEFGKEHTYSKALAEAVSQKCGNCHTGAAFDYKRSIHKGDSKKNSPNCVDCHGGHLIKLVGESGSPVVATQIAITCAQQCHKNQFEQFSESFHGKAVALGAKNAPDCISCHGYHRVLSKNNPIDQTHQKNKQRLCAKCHEGEILGVGTIEHYEMKPEGYGKPMYYLKTKLPWLVIVVMTVFLVHIILDLIHRIRLRNK